MFFALFVQKFIYIYIYTHPHVDTPRRSAQTHEPRLKQGQGFYSKTLPALQAHHTLCKYTQRLLKVLSLAFYYTVHCLRVVKLAY